MTKKGNEMGVIYFILGIMGAAYVIIGGGVFLVFITSGGFAEAGGAVFIPPLLIKEIFTYTFSFSLLFHRRPSCKFYHPCVGNLLLVAVHQLPVLLLGASP